MIQSPTDSIVISPKAFDQISQTGGDSTQSDNPVVPSISALMSHRRPNAVGRFVISVFAHAFNRPSFLARPHIIKEIRERIPPSFADFDVAAAIPLIILSVWILATGNHARLNDIGSGSFTSAGLSVLDIDFESSASAGCRKPTPNCVVPSDYFLPTVAEENASVLHESVASESWLCGSDEFEASKSFSDGEGFDRHNGFSITVIASGGRLAPTSAYCDFGLSCLQRN